MNPIDTGSAKPQHDPPIAMEPYDLGRAGDLGALSNEQQWHTNILKTRTRINNERYLRNHPEINHMISAFLRDLLLKQPKDPRQHFTDFFTHPDLITRIEEVKEEYEQQHHDDMVVRKLAGESCFNDNDEESA
ncbi:RIIa domain-containing protein 1 [Fasciola gigantica]|uniref:RIIa domain-containing protein 1 n=1 Tax=Fasciola gigantica TaxID=46835 RepID=A0A504YZ87_FASGI|nr:RIIa domain-containing protein 1 [Fasciola gigantica]